MTCQRSRSRSASHSLRGSRCATQSPAAMARSRFCTWRERSDRAEMNVAQRSAALRQLALDIVAHRRPKPVLRAMRFVAHQRLGRRQRPIAFEILVHDQEVVLHVSAQPMIALRRIAVEVAVLHQMRFKHCDRVAPGNSQPHLEIAGVAISVLPIHADIAVDRCADHGRRADQEVVLVRKQGVEDHGIGERPVASHFLRQLDAAIFAAIGVHQNVAGEDCTDLRMRLQIGDLLLDDGR